MDKGKIVEEGKHESLIAMRGLYYTLVKNQLKYMKTQKFYTAPEFWERTLFGGVFPW